MDAEEQKLNEKWSLVMKEVYRRARFHTRDYNSEEDLAGLILEHLVRVDKRKPQWNLVDNKNLRVRIETNKIYDWYRQRKTYLNRYQPLIVKDDETGKERETAFGRADVSYNDDQFAAFERRDFAEVANREIRKVSGKRGAQVLDAVTMLDTLIPAVLAETLDMQPEAVNSQFCIMRKKSKSLNI